MGIWMDISMASVIGILSNWGVDVFRAFTKGTDIVTLGHLGAQQAPQKQNVF